MKQEKENTEQLSEEQKQSSVLLIGKEGDGEKVKPDERFFIDEADVVEDKKEKEDEKPKKVFGKEFKKQIKQENRKAKIAVVKNKFSNVFKITYWAGLARFLDFTLNLISVVFVLFGVIVTAKYLIEGEPLMVAVGCLFIGVTIYLNEKIS